jgi:general stress protein 26
MTAAHTAPDARPLTEVLVDLRIAMVTTAVGPVWKSRPLVLAGMPGPTLHFLVSAEADWVQALDESGSPTTVTFSDPNINEYVALQGRARAVRDEALIGELWNAEAKAYFSGTDDPALRVLEVEIEHGEYWDSPAGTIGRLFALAKAAAGGDAGREGPISL